MELITISPIQDMDSVTTTGNGHGKQRFIQHYTDAAAVCQGRMNAGEQHAVQGKQPEYGYAHQNAEKQSDFCRRNAQNVTD